MRHRIHKGRGFTLLEIVVAVAIFGVISAIVFPALLQFLEMRERVNEKHLELTGLQKTFLFLANDLRFAVNRLAKDEYGEIGKTTVTLRDDSLIEFTTAYPDVSLHGLNVPRRVKWQLNEGVLQRIQSPVMDPESETRTIVQSLLENVSNVDIEVSYVEDGRNTTSNKWEEQTRLPDLIEIEIELENNQQYRRAFSMLGADNGAAATAAGAVSNGTAAPNSASEANGISAPDSDIDSDEDGILGE